MEAVSQATWEVYPLLSKEQFKDASELGIDPLQAQILANRGITDPKEMRAFIDASYEETPDPFRLIDMSSAVERIRRALVEREHITVYGDYDADGVTSSSLLFRALRKLKHPEAPLDYHIPHRLRDGCGFNLPALDQLKARGTSLIITTDCASSDVEQVEHARSLGIDVIITDHHHPPAELPKAYAMVNPWRPECTYGERYLCGAGVAFKLVQALYRTAGFPQEEELDLLDLVAVGTIADIAPLLGENHTLARLGLGRLNTTNKPGLKALIHNANLQPGRIRERDIAFGLAPRINAAGRMKHASLAFDLLVTDSEEEAAQIANELEQLNLTRQQETEELMKNVREQAQQQPTTTVVLVDGDNWHEGIIGLVAGKLAEEINKPVLVLSNDTETNLSRGSARSQKDFNIIGALRNFGDRLERYGGHAQAAGFTIRSERIEEFREHLLNWKEHGDSSLEESMLDVAEEHVEPAVPLSSMIDLVFTKMDRINYDLYQKMHVLAPFGASNPEPVFKMERLRLLNKRFTGYNKRNLRLLLGAATGHGQQKGTMKRGAHKSETLNGISHVDVIFKLVLSEYENRQEIEMNILEVLPTKG